MNINKQSSSLIQKLYNQDICIRCILRIFKVTDINSYRDRSYYNQLLIEVGKCLGEDDILIKDYDFLKLKKKSEQHQEITQSLTQVHSTLREQYIRKPIYEIDNQNNCSICLGIMQIVDDKEFLNIVYENIKQRDYEFDSFKFSVKTPNGSQLRQLLIVNQCVSELQIENKEQFQILITPNYSVDQKAVVKWILSYYIADAFKVKGDAYDDRFTINMSFENLSDDLEQFKQFKQIVEDIEDQEWEDKLQKKLKMNDPKLKADTHNRLLQKKHQAQQPFLPTQSNLDRIFKVSHEKLKQLTISTQFIYKTKVDISTQYQNIFIKGNYIKLARYISQTPWIIDGNKLYETSIQDLVSELASTIFRPQSLKFHSGGREDIDVRMLGNGRPFMLELVDPHRNDSLIKKETLELLQADINKNSQIRVNSLAFTDNSCFADLKESETNKIKAYCCIVECKNQINQELVDKCNQIKDLIVNQKTPLRVLHRRTLMIRQKIIHALKLIKLNERWLKVYVLSSAGTYIKEFIHSDLERTVPSLCDLLDNECDIFQLDVVKLYEVMNEENVNNFYLLDEEAKAKH